MSATLSPLFTWRTAIAKSDLPPTVRLVAFALSLYMNELGGSAWPSISTLAADSGLSTRSVMRGVRTLEKEKYLTCERQHGVSTRYRASVPTQLDLLRIPPEGDSLTGVTESPVSEWHPTSDTGSPNPGHSVTRSSQEHVKNTPKAKALPPDGGAESNGKGKDGAPFYLADVVNLGLVVSLAARYERIPAWKKVTAGLLTGLVLGSESKKLPACGPKAVNAAIDDLYANAAGVKDPAGYLKDRAAAYASEGG